MSSDCKGQGLDSELESFRQQWISDLQSRKEPVQDTSSSSQQSTSPTTTRTAAQGHSKKHHGPPSPTLAKRQAIMDEGSDYLQGRAFDEPAQPEQVGHVLSEDAPAPKPEKELVSALDHYEEAMEKESQGNMGESLRLYRRAYRLDHGVDHRYREKHFPAGSKAPAVSSASATTSASATASTSAPTNPASSSQAASTTAAATGSSETPAPAPAPAPLPPMRELLASFASLQIEPALPDVEGEPPLPCPISTLPAELIVHILRDVAISDVADFVRLSLVCKRLAYLVASEQRIWRRICLGTEFGFPGMHYRWNTGIEWDPLQPDSDSDVEESSSDPESSTTVISPRERQLQRDAALYETTLSLYTPSAHPTWKHMFRHRPRIRFNGCYISTVNYVRSGQLSTNQATWGGAPIHIVTYYRYLRFFRDGSVISLLTSNEPGEVVHHLTPELLLLHRDSAASQSHFPSAVMSLAQRGRWHLSHPVPPGVTSASGNNNRHGGNAGAISGDDDVSIETEGVGSKYIFKMELALRSAGKSNVSRNNKLVWRSFFSYNKLTDDWGEFRLKNDKPYFFSRVRSYGLGLE